VLIKLVKFGIHGFILKYLWFDYTLSFIKVIAQQANGKMVQRGKGEKGKRVKAKYRRSYATPNLTLPIKGEGIKTGPDGA
jgi:hypothetical protein